MIFFVKLKSTVFICDSPARSYLQCIKSHSGYDGCGYCRVVGIHVQGDVRFLDVNHEFRTDTNYNNFEESNQIRRSLLCDVLPLRASFPPEYMHLVCLGVVRKLLLCYFLTLERQSGQKGPLFIFKVLYCKRLKS